MTPAELKALRNGLAISQEALARLLDVTTSAVSKWESGARPISRRTELALQSVQRQQSRKARP